MIFISVDSFVCDRSFPNSWLSNQHSFVKPFMPKPCLYNRKSLSIQHAFRHSLECIQARHIYTTVVRRETLVEVSHGAPKNVYI